jgi:two-component system sensor histidine kinase KdpD
MTRLESGHVTPKLEWCDLSDLIQVTLKSLEKELAQHPVRAEISPNLPLIKMDFVLMQQVLTNLLLNAAVHTPSGTAVHIQAYSKDATIRLAVSDNGPGLPADVLPFIFDKFFRAPSAPAGGTGLGLAIVKGFVEAQGGRIQAENLPSGGAAFTIRLPFSKPPAVPMEATT